MMNRNFLLSILCVISIHASQAQESISLQPGYTQDVFYSFANGEVGASASNNWDLAFEISGFSASIRINSIKGINLWAVPAQGINGWETLDTTGLSSWEQSYNSEISWNLGAFNAGIDLSNPFDLGWGVYNQVTHTVSGDSLYLIQLGDGSYRKIRIDQLSGGIYSFTYAKLDGSEEVSAKVNKADFANKAFGYYSFEGDTIVQREPDADKWDMVFTRYMAELSPGVKYGVMGVLTNPAVEVAELANTDLGALSLNDTTGLDFSSDISVIGYDWKSFDFNSNSYLMKDSLGYFVRAQDGFTYLLNFTSFGGSATGDVGFAVSQLATSIDSEAIFGNFQVYPNPNEGSFSLRYELKESGPIRIQLLDLDGRLVHEQIQEQGFGASEVHINQNQLPGGIYLLKVSGSEASLSSRVIIR